MLNGFFIKGMIYGSVDVFFTLVGGSIAKKFNIYNSVVTLNVLLVILLAAKILNIVYFDILYFSDAMTYVLCAVIACSIVLNF